MEWFANLIRIRKIYNVLRVPRTRLFSWDLPWFVGDRASSLTLRLDESTVFRDTGLLDLRLLVVTLGVGDLDLCFPKSAWWFELARNFLCGVGLLERFIFLCSSLNCWCCCLLPAWWGVGDRERLLEMLLGACSCTDCRFCVVPALEPTLDAELLLVLGGDLGGKNTNENRAL